ncbi:MAG: hypothetical protein KF849_18335 [Rhizobiaceae bacterium]|nr:hypothetical protein [Rhizobiaceae bacterium]
MSETALYAPIKAFLETCGYAVKGEIGGCDVLAVRDGEPPLLVVCELKLRFNLELVLQGVERASASDEVWLAANVSGRGREADSRFRALCRRLGFGMLGVFPDSRVEVIVSPVSPFPRVEKRRRSRLYEEWRNRRGDPATGGSTRTKIMTAYRQEALACAGALAAGPLRPRDLKPHSGRAQGILADNHYGWFVREARGLYGLTDAGRAALLQWSPAGSEAP